MPTGRGLSFTAIQVLQAVAAGRRYGFDIMDLTGLPSGTVYPALSRLERDGLLRSGWEREERAHEEGRPQRRYYRLTGYGVEALEAALDRLRRLEAERSRAVSGLDPAPGGAGG